MEKYKSYKHYSKEYLLKFSSTKLTELEKNISANKGTRLQYVSSAYLYFWKNKESLLKYPTLLKIREEFEKVFNNEKVDSQYKKIINTLNNKVNNKKIDHNFKIKVIEEVEKISKNKKINYRFVSTIIILIIHHYIDFINIENFLSFLEKRQVTL